MWDDGTLALAVSAGVVAALNPCGFALLPAYLSLLVLDDQSSRPVAVARALRATTAMTIGFAAVFALFGLAVAPVAVGVQLYLPGFTVVLGLVLAAAGAWLMTGRTLPSPRLRRRGPRRVLTESAWSMAGFGASYAVASLGCTIAPFLAVVVSAFRSGSTLRGVVLFVAYGVGMGLLVGTVAVAVALARAGLILRVRRAGRLLPRVGGLLLLVAGGYVAWYGVWELRVLHAGAGADPVVDSAAHVQQWMATSAQSLGAAGFFTLLAVLLLLALLVRRAVASGKGAQPGGQGIQRDVRGDGHGEHAEEKPNDHLAPAREHCERRRSAQVARPPITSSPA